MILYLMCTIDGGGGISLVSDIHPIQSIWTVLSKTWLVPSLHWYVFLVTGNVNAIWSYTLSTFSWWRHQMETFSTLLVIYVGNSPVPGEFPAQRPVTRSFAVFFDLRLNKRLSKQSWGWWFETLSCSLWRHRNVHCKWLTTYSLDGGLILAPGHYLSWLNMLTVVKLVWMRVVMLSSCLLNLTFVITPK